MTKISKFTLFRVAFRTHLMLSMMNYQRMLNLSFLWALLPVFQRFNLSHDRYKEVLKRHLNFFNAHPYMSGIVLGIMATHEEKWVQEIDPENQKRIASVTESLRKGFMGPMGALGDSFFWQSWRPFCGIIAILLSVLLLPDVYAAGVGILFSLLLYNVIHEYVIFRGVFSGYRLSDEMIRTIHQYNIPKLNDKIKNAGTFMGGMVIGVLSLATWLGPVWIPTSLIMNSLARISVLGLASIAFIFGMRKGWSMTQLFLVVLGGMALIDLILWF